MPTRRGLFKQSRKILFGLETGFSFQQLDWRALQDWSKGYNENFPSAIAYKIPFHFEYHFLTLKS